MYLRISSPQAQLYEGEVEQLTIPTEGGEITILPDHQPLATVVIPWILKLKPAQVPEDTGFVIDQGTIAISVSKGLMFVDGEKILVTTTAATKSPTESEEVLESMQIEMKQKLDAIRVSGNQEDIEEAITNLEKITADLRLSRLSGMSR